MEPKRTLHSGNLVRGFHVGDRKLFMEKYYDPEKYLVRWDDMKEAFKIAQRQKELQRQDGKIE